MSALEEWRRSTERQLSVSFGRKRNGGFGPPARGSGHSCSRALVAACGPLRKTRPLIVGDTTPSCVDDLYQFRSSALSSQHDYSPRTEALNLEIPRQR
jgi:hypothetical protein